MSDDDARIEKSLQELDELFAGFFPWLAGRYDSKSGGFFYAPSSRTLLDFEPDIESTAQALSILERSELLDRLPRPMIEGLVAFFRGKQDRDSGFFLDRDPNMRKDEVMVARAMGYASRSLRRLGSSPAYPLPEAAAEPDHMRSPESYLDWLARTDLRSSWRGCDLMMSANHYIERMPSPRREAFVEAARGYFAEIQDPETGLWGEGNPYTRISGTFKMNMFYKAFDIEMPRAQAVYGTILACLRGEEARDMCWIRNPIDLIGSLRDRIDLPREEWAEILAITASNMRALLRADGGFSRELAHSPVAPNVAQVKEGESCPRMPVPVPLGRGLVEGDMNAGTQAMLIRDTARSLSGREPQSLSRYSGDFERALRAGARAR
jgi:hypothetical protein